MELLPSEFYSQNVADRSTYESRAKTIADLSVPYIYRSAGGTGSTPLGDTLMQSFNGRLVNTLKSKMGMALLPPATSSFKLIPDPQAMAAITGGNEQKMAELNQMISSAVATINKELESQQIRETLFNIIAQLIVVGCVIAEKVERKGVKYHTLNNIVVDLDSQGEPLTMCFVEELKRLPEGITVSEEQETYMLYTMLNLDPERKDTWVMTQDIDGTIVGKEKTYKTVDMPFRYIGWTWIPGDTFHRPYAEDYVEDMSQMNKLAELLTDGALLSAMQILFVDERGGRTRKKAVANAVNGDIVDGSAEDVSVLKLNKNYDFQVGQEREAEIKRDLSAAFLMNSSATRDAERVTAEEVRFMAQELESSSMSGIYSKLAKTWSKWIIEMIMKEIGIKFDAIDVKVITGLDALGRSVESQKLDGAVTRTANLNMMSWIKEQELVTRIFDQQGVETTNLIKTPQEREQEMQKAQQQAAEQQMRESAASAAGPMAQDAANAARDQAAQEQQAPQQ